MLGVLLAVPHTKLWHRLEKEGRLRQDVGEDLGTFSAMNFEPSRPEAEIMQEYVDAWNYLYEPSRYLARTYRYYLAMRPAHRDPERAAGGPGPKTRSPVRKFPGAIYSTRPSPWAKFFGGKVSGRRTGANTGPR